MKENINNSMKMVIVLLSVLFAVFASSLLLKVPISSNEAENIELKGFKTEKSAISSYMVDVYDVIESNASDECKGIVYGDDAYYTVQTKNKSGNADVLLIKWDQYGTQIWNRTWGGPGSDIPEEIYFDFSGYKHIWVLGSSDSWNSSNNMLILRYDQAGNLLGNATWGGPGNDVATVAVYEGSSDYFKILGYSNSWSTKDNIVALYWIYGANDIGSCSLNHSWGDDLNNYHPVGGYSDIIAGNNFSTAIESQCEIFIMELNNDMTVINWNLSWSNSLVDRVIAMETKQSMIYLTGATEMNSGIPKLFLLQYYSTGVLWNETVFTEYSGGTGFTRDENYIYTVGFDQTGYALWQWNDSCDLQSNCSWTDGVSNNRGWGVQYHTGYNSFAVLGETIMRESSGDTSLSILAIDSDNDGLGNVTEYQYATDPLDADSDDDGLIDSVEVYIYSTNPNNWDTDGDSIGDKEEINAGTNPLDPNDPPDEIPGYSLSIIGLVGIGCTILFILQKKSQIRAIFKRK